MFSVLAVLLLLGAMVPETFNATTPDPTQRNTFAVFQDAIAADSPRQRAGHDDTRKIVLGIDGSHFTIDRRRVFLCGISYYGGLGASKEFVVADLDDIQRYGFNWIRVWATWSAFDNDVSAVDNDGRSRQPYFDRLRWLIAECDRRGLVVDVTFTRGESIGSPHLSSDEAHEQAVRTLVAGLTPYRNWYLDLANEHNIRGGGKTPKTVSFETLARLRNAAKAIDPDRLLTASYVGDASKEDLHRYLHEVRVDFVSPHRRRNAHSAAETSAKTREALEFMKQLGRVVPVHCQEPFRRDFNPSWQPQEADFVRDLAGAIEGGAAGWCLHNGDARRASKGRPRRSFDMRRQRLFDQLDDVERQVLEQLPKLLEEHSVRRRDNDAGPLRIHPGNPRYFTHDGRQAVYLTGSHTWHNLQDGGPTDPPVPFDYEGFLDFLAGHHHNFFRLWAWEDDREAAWMRQRYWCRPLVYRRTGPGTAVDGKLKFDLTRYDPEYFQRLRDRVRLAKERGMYVGVMLFQGFSVARKSPRAQGNPWSGHPLHRDNNINGISGDADGDGNGYEVHTLDNPRITAIQEDYVRKVIDTVGSFDNVIYEISNESHGGSTAWQYHMIDVIRNHEKRREKQHPVWMSFQWDGTIGMGTNRSLWQSKAEAVSPQESQKELYRSDPPVADGSKAIILDTDHLWGIGGDADWVWKAFARGMNPIFMDPYQKDSPPDRPAVDPKWDGIRRAMGFTRQIALRVDLAAMTPTDDARQCSTRYCLRNPGREVLVYQPKPRPFTLLLERGRYEAEWLDPGTGRTKDGGVVTSVGEDKSFTAPWPDSPSVLYLKAAD
ncbi:MAG: hypothetical protein JW810_05550 [Sedimentisphaerales bacterium]|nr:hypothetical protein [Sedimentisphaerales bacterium]